MECSAHSYSLPKLATSREKISTISDSNGSYDRKSSVDGQDGHTTHDLHCCNTVSRDMDCEGSRFTPACHEPAAGYVRRHAAHAEGKQSAELMLKPKHVFRLSQRPPIYREQQPGPPTCPPACIHTTQTFPIPCHSSIGAGRAHERNQMQTSRNTENEQHDEWRSPRHGKDIFNHMVHVQVALHCCHHARMVQ